MGRQKQTVPELFEQDDTVESLFDQYKLISRIETKHVIISEYAMYITSAGCRVIIIALNKSDNSVSAITSDFMPNVYLELTNIKETDPNLKKYRYARQ